MLNFKEDQARQVDEQHAAKFLRELADFLREEFAEELAKVDDAALLRMCRTVIDEADSLGIDQQGPIAQLACLAIGTAGGILREPEIREYLSNEELGQEERVQLLVDMLDAEDD